MTLPELLIALAVVAILASASVPALQRYVSQIRVRSALDRVVAEIYRARMLAVETGAAVRVVFTAGPNGCIERFRIVIGSDPWRPQPSPIPLDVESPCVRHNGDSVLVFNGRGMLRPPARSIFVADEAAADSVLISIAGRVRRNY